MGEVKPPSANDRPKPETIVCSACGQAYRMMPNWCRACGRWIDEASETRAQLATLRADRDALAARVTALERELRIEREDHARYLQGPGGAPIFREAAQERLAAIDAALAAPAPGATPERGGMEGGEG